MEMSFEDLFKQVCAANGWATHGNEATVTIAGGRSQRIHWQQFHHGEKDMVRLYSYIGTSEKLSQVRLEAALRLNFSLPHGALAIHSEKLVMTETFLVSDADLAEVESAVRFLSEMADRYEKLIYDADRH
jgi:hypothetical protein